ncbi:MAG: SIS domain-containing protein [Proteobacteria bacterium]|nr:SIS domain-containing protein [Pseudomonadota bacterium]
MTGDASTRMAAEAQESHAAVARQLAANDVEVARLAASLRAHPPRFIVTCARGSSDHAATFAKYVFETQVGLFTASASPSVSSVYAARQNLDGALYLAISQSGKSPDLVHHAQSARAAGARVVALVNHADSPLAAVAEAVIPLHAGAEISVAATKSYICTLAAILHLAARWREDTVLLDALFAVPEGLRRGWSLDWSPLVDGLAAVRNLFVIGRGFGFGAALEAALKFKETCALHAEAFSAAEVRHGPMALVGAEFPVLFFSQNDDSREGTLALAREFRERGARVLVAAPGTDPLPVAESAHPACTPLLAIQSFYRAASALSLRRGLNPDVPPHLRKVTETI